MSWDPGCIDTGPASGSLWSEGSVVRPPTPVEKYVVLVMITVSYVFTVLAEYVRVT